MSVSSARGPWFAALRERLARRIAPWLYDDLLESAKLAASLPLSVPEARYDDLVRLDDLHRRLGLMP